MEIKGISGIFVVAMLIGMLSVIGLSLIATSADVYDTLAGSLTFPAAANTAMDNVTSTLYGIWPISPLIALALFGAAAIAAFSTFRT